jgi:hypothetical protein
MAAGNDSKRRQLDEFCANYTVFVGMLCFVAFFLFGWEIILTWIFFRSGMRLLHDVMTDTPSSRSSHNKDQRRCRD